MNYKLPELDLSKSPKVFVGNRSRWATATAVSFVTDNLILVASFLGKKIYLIDLDNMKILTETNTVDYPDLLDYKDGLIGIAQRNGHGKFGNIGLYELKDNIIKHIREIDLKNYTELHGIRVIDENKIIFTDKSKGRGVHILEWKTDKISSYNNFKFFPCDIFLLNNQILVLTTETKPNNSGLKNYNTKLSHLHLFDFPSFKEISKVSFEGQVDCISYDNNVGFITVQNDDSLFHFSIQDNKLYANGFVKKDFSFPHGVAMKNNKVIVTNYGTNSLSIFDSNNI